MSTFTPHYGVTTTLKSKVIKRTVTVCLSPRDIVIHASKLCTNSSVKDVPDADFKEAEFLEEDDNGNLIFRCELLTPTKEEVNE